MVSKQTGKTKPSEQTPAVSRLKYKRGDLIIKEGDYGISIYQIIRGRVGLFTESEGTETHLATLGPGEIIGEMTFFSGSSNPRTASARALEDCELEALHPARLSKEYAEMPRMLKYIIDQEFKRIVRMNRVITELDIKKTRKRQLEQKNPWALYRKFYRKEVDFDCVYRPLNTPQRVVLEGRIKDISKGGLRLDISAENMSHFSHQLGDIFFISAFLPTGEHLGVTAELASLVKSRTEEPLSLGMTFVRITEQTNKTLGFFLMP